MHMCIQVLTHEMCHVFGLKHCHFFNCAMNESSSILQAALQPLFLCPICLRKLQKVLQFDVLGRYQAMAEQCLELFEATQYLSATDEISASSALRPSSYCTSLQDCGLLQSNDVSCITVSTMTTANSMAATLSEASCEASSMFSGVSGVVPDFAHPPDPWSHDVGYGRATKSTVQFASEEEVLKCPSKHFEKAHGWLQNAIHSGQLFLKAVADSRQKKAK